MAEHQCNRNGCSAAAQWQIGVRLWPDELKEAGTEIQGPMGMWVCDQHRELSASDVLIAENRRSITAAMQKAGYIEPAWRTAEIYLIPRPAWLEGYGTNL